MTILAIRKRTWNRELRPALARRKPIGSSGVRGLFLVAGLALGCGESPPTSPVEAPRTEVNVVLVTLDTTRADHLSPYGAVRETSPNLEALARCSTVFTRAYSTSTWTGPSHASIFTGLLPRDHGCHMRPGGEEETMLALRSNVPTLAEILSEAGWATSGFVGGPVLARALGFGRGFDHYDDRWEGPQRMARQINAKVFDWLDQVGDRSFFLFVNYFDPHGPYEPDSGIQYPFEAPSPQEGDYSSFSPGVAKRNRGAFPESQEEIDSVVLRYDQEIYATDAHLGDLIETLRRKGLWDNTLFVVTADHGEAFGERLGEVAAWGHGLMPALHQCHVPLLIREPGQKLGEGRRVEATVSNGDLVPTILATLNLEGPNSRGGRDLIRVADGVTEGLGAVAEKYSPDGYGVAYWDGVSMLLELEEFSSKQTIRTLVEFSDPKRPRMLREQRLEDPGLELSVADRERVRQRFEDLLRGRTSFLETRGSRSARGGQDSDSTGIEIDAETRAKLEALGYVEE